MEPRVTSSPPDDLAEPSVERRRVSPIWAVPIVAVLIAGWLGFTTWRQQGPTITIQFRSAEGLEAGKTPIKHKDIPLGVVHTIVPADDLSRVIVTAKMNRYATPHLTTGTRFWVVRPRIGLSGISGLETLVAGSYVELDPNKGDRTDSFIGLEEPPIVRADVPGKTFLLRADRLGSLRSGAPIFFRDLKVGEMLGHELGENADWVTILAFVQAPYDQYVHNNTQFWNASGVSLTTGPDGVRLNVESLEAVLGGGIAFETPRGDPTSNAANDRSTFRLYKDAESVKIAGFSRREPYVAYFSDSVRGLSPGSPVEWRGIRVGTVTDVQIEYDPRTQHLRIPVALEFEPERIKLPGGGTPAKINTGTLAEFVARGLRAQLRSGNLITGQLVVALDVFHDAPKAELVWENGVPILPTVPSELDSIVRSASAVMERLAGLPLEEIGQNVRDTTRSLKRLAASPDLTEALKAVRAATISIDTVAKRLDVDLIPALKRVPAIAANAETALKRVDSLLAGVETDYGTNSQFKRDVVRLTSQLNDAARAIRLLADYLEQHPDALVRGKTGKAKE
jgi:paraquat-inducible protein B